MKWRVRPARFGRAGILGGVLPGGRVASATAWAGSLLASSLGVLSLPAGGPAMAASYVTPPTSSPAAAGAVASQAQTARSRLSTALGQAHPGQPEALFHAAADHMGGADPTVRIGAAAPVVASSAARLSAASSASAAPGMDVSSYQGDVDWASALTAGATFAYMKATEGTYYYDSSYFAQQYNGSYSAGLVRGAYHFAIPSNSTGAAQADYFVANGGGWSPDGHTLPGTLDIEYNPYGAECYGLTSTQMVSWLQSFDGEYRSLTGRYPTIYTTTGWWQACTGNSAAFAQEGLAIASYGSSPSPLPASWSSYDIWQYADQGVFPGDQDVFDGSASQLVSFAYGPAVIASSVSLVCGATGDLRTSAEASVRSGVVVYSASTYQTDTVDSNGSLQAIPTSSPSPSTPLVAVWQNSTDCSGADQTRNAWTVGPTGSVYAETSLSGPAAQSFGDASKLPLVKPVVGMSPTSDANGYWLVASDGGIFSYGDARFFGSTGGVHLVQPIVGMATTPGSAGYWMVASDGGVFAFGDAPFHGSLGGIHLVKPIEAMVATPDAKGYWMVASDGGVFCFGDASFKGSMGGKQLSAPIAGLVPNGTGYTLIGQDGRTYPFA